MPVMPVDWHCHGKRRKHVYIHIECKSGCASGAGGGIVIKLCGLRATVIGSGCGGAATVAYIKGTAESNYDADIDRCQVAAREVLWKLNMTITDEPDSQGKSRSIHAKSCQSDEISMTLKSLTPASTKISVHINTFGDQEMSMQILEAIRDKLKESK